MLPAVPPAAAAAASPQRRQRQFLLPYSRSRRRKGCTNSKGCNNSNIMHKNQKLPRILLLGFLVLTITTTTQQAAAFWVQQQQRRRVFFNNNKENNHHHHHHHTTSRTSLSSQQQQQQQQLLQKRRDKRQLVVSLAASSSSSSTTTTNEPRQKPKQLTLYNSRTRSKDIFQPINSSANQISMYTCGPTVYDYAHIGNFRAFLTYDVMKRALMYLGYDDIIHICNLTDIDDKIINRANELELESIKELTTKYEEEFLYDLKLLNVVPATEYPRASEHIDAMMDIILLLASKELAYETSDGSWYFRTQNQPGYGKQLVELNFDDMMEQQETLENDDEKEHFADFCLWKAYKDGVDREDAVWSSDKIRLGRPGWHLECSAMARKFFGDNTIDLHGGGIDLKFPHHENEIAQSQGVYDNKVFCNCWFHNGFVNLDNEKMSKSLGNFLTLRTACPTPLDIRAYRYLVTSSQYRNPLAFTPQAMQASKNAIKRIDKVKASIEGALKEAGDLDGDRESDIAVSFVPKVMENFDTAIRDDLSMPRAAAALFSLVKEAEKELKRANNDNAKEGSEELDYVGLKSILDAMEQMDRVFGIFYDVPLQQEGVDGESSGNDDDKAVPAEVAELVSQRSAAKDAKDWELADSLRTRIQELGFAVKDVKGGEPVISRIE